MNDNVSLALGGGQRSGLGGLPQRLVQDGVVEEAAMLEALNAARERKIGIVTMLVTSIVTMLIFRSRAAFSASSMAASSTTPS